MGYLTDEDYDDLPDGDQEAFARLESAARRKMMETATRDDDGDIVWQELGDYMNEIAALSHSLNIPDVYWSPDAENYTTEYVDFTRRVEFQLTQIRLNRARRLAGSNVNMSGPARLKIQHWLEKLKAEVEGSELDEKRKRRLDKIIADFESELAKPKLNLATAALLFMALTTFAHDTEGLLLDTPKTIAEIAKVIDDLHTLDNERRQQLVLPPTPPLRAIPDMRSSGQTRRSLDEV